MSREYTAVLENQAIAISNGDYDLIEILPATQKPVTLRGIGIHVLTEVQEAQEEWLRCNVIRGHTTSGTGGTTVTPQPCDPGDAAFSGTVEMANTAIASAGTAVNLHPFGVNVRAGYEIFYPGNFGKKVVNNQLLVVRLMAAAADDFNADLCFWLEEE